MAHSSDRMVIDLDDEPNGEKVILTKKVKDHPLVKEGYKSARKDFIAFAKSYNLQGNAVALSANVTGAIPASAYEADKKEEIRGLRQAWLDLDVKWPELPFEPDESKSKEEQDAEDILEVLIKMRRVERVLTSTLGSCDLWVKYTASMADFQHKAWEYANDTHFWKQRLAGKLQLPGEPPRDPHYLFKN